MKSAQNSMETNTNAAQFTDIQERLTSQLSQTLHALMNVRDDTSLAFVRETAQQMSKMLDLARQGRSVSIVPLDEELSTQKAADLLNVSRPFLVNLLERGEIRFHKVGSHRRVLARDLLKFKDADDERRENAADELTRQAQDLSLGY